MRKLGIAVIICVMGVMGFAVAIALSAPPPAPPGQNPCEHGNAQKPCRDDPQPNHGQDCDPHGKFNGGENEDHCTSTETTTTTDTTTTTTTGNPRGVATAGTFCVISEQQYHVFGTIDGTIASVSPDRIPGTKSGPTIITVTLGADSQQVIVTTDGTCVATTTTTTTTDTTCVTNCGGGSGGGGTTTTGTTVNDSTTISTTTESTPTTTTGETTTNQETTTPAPKPKPKPKPKPPAHNNIPPKKHTTTNKKKMPPLCPVGVPANSPQQPCAVQGSG